MPRHQTIMLGILAFCLLLEAAAGDQPSACCGYANRAGTTRIVGGQETEAGEYPWQAMIVDRQVSSLLCGASVINNRYVLTAEHCVEYQTPQTIQVLLGVHGSDNLGSVAQRFNVSEIISHPSTEFYVDAALVKLASSISFSDSSIAPVCLASSGDFSDVDVIITGWGMTAEDGSLATALQEVTLRTMNNSQCRQSYGPVIRSSMLCAAASGKGACAGDSGGPVVTELAPGRYQQVGIVAFSIGCARRRYPDVNTRVTYIHSWITEETAGASLC